MEEIWKIKISSLAKTARVGHFKSNKEFLSIVLIKNSIVFTFLCRFWHQNKCFSIPKFLGKLDFLQKKIYNINYRKYCSLVDNCRTNLCREVVLTLDNSKLHIPAFSITRMKIEILLLHAREMEYIECASFVEIYGLNIA